MICMLCRMHCLQHMLCIMHDACLCMIQYMLFVLHPFKHKGGFVQKQGRICMNARENVGSETNQGMCMWSGATPQLWGTRSCISLRWCWTPTGTPLWVRGLHLGSCLHLHPQLRSVREFGLLASMPPGGKQGDAVSVCACVCMYFVFIITVCNVYGIVRGCNNQRPLQHSMQTLTVSVLLWPIR